ncbi:MAG: hypothetical protein AAFN13_12620 [Bacteroidota bacterium]
MSDWATITSLVLPKQGHTDAECEDAVAVRETGTALQLAMADGATEAAYSRRWAQALVEAGVALEAKARIAEAVDRARASFEATTAQQKAGLPWYAEQKAQEGAFATLLRLRVRLMIDRSLGIGGSWEGEAVGDVTLFHLQAGDPIWIWPNDDPNSFGSRPALVASNSDLDPDTVERFAATWRPGDVLLVTTDALAAYLLAEEAALRRLVHTSQNAWSDFVDHARADGMRNDDVALVRIDLHGP